jgi:hypothetical protein
MKITIESTSKIVNVSSVSDARAVNGVDARVWEGHTESGIPVHCFVTRIAVHRSEDASQFERELQEQRAPSAVIDAAYPARVVL